MYLLINFDLPSDDPRITAIKKNQKVLPAIAPYRITNVESLNGNTQLCVRVSLNYREELRNYLKVDYVGNGEPPVISVTLPDLLDSSVTVGDDISLGQEFDNIPAYISYWMLPHVKPWQTFNYYLKTLSKEWQLDTFLKIVADMVYIDCEGIVDASIEDKRDEFVNQVDHDYRGFVRSVIDNGWVDLSQVYEYAESRVNAGLYLNSIAIKDK